MSFKWTIYISLMMIIGAIGYVNITAIPGNPELGHLHAFKVGSSHVLVLDTKNIDATLVDTKPAK